MNIIGTNKYGCIEGLHMVKGQYRSFNIYKWREDKTSVPNKDFIRSCYKHNTAIKTLGNYEPRRQPKQLRK